MVIFKDYGLYIAVLAVIATKITMNIIWNIEDKEERKEEMDYLAKKIAEEQKNIK